MAALALLGTGNRSSAQAPSGGVGRVGATRSELDRLAARAEAAASVDTTNTLSREQNLREAAAVRARLLDGDFRPGDQVLLTVPTDSALSDTFVVRAGGAGSPVLRLPNLPEIPLRGVLRSELQSYLIGHVGRFLKDTLIRAAALVPVGVLGELARPGYYQLPIDAPLRDVVMAAGGPTPDADVTRITVRRGTRQFMSRPEVRAAIVKGLTLDELGVTPGDEVLVARRRERRWPTVLQTVSMVTSIVVGLFATGVFGGR